LKGKYELDKLQTECDLNEEKLQYDLDLQIKTSEEIVAIKDKELEKAYEIIKSTNKNNTSLWIGVGFAAGIATSLLGGKKKAPPPPKPVDIFKRKGMDEVSVNSPISIVTEHVKSQTSFFPVPEEYEEQPHKWTNHWKITTPKGYSCLFIHPLNSPQLPFHSFSGIVDTDKHPLIINFPFVFKKDFEGVIPAGTPIIQIIPFKRDSWDLKVIDDKEFVPYEKTYEVFNPPFSWYKKYFWSKKEYR
jgi:hypothetical protein